MNTLQYLNYLQNQLPPEIEFTNDTNFPEYNSHDIIDIYYLESPLQILGDFVKRSNLFSYKLFEVNGNHTGVGFVYRKNNVEFAIDYSAYDFMSVFFPKIENNNITWNNQTHIIYHPYIDRDYWRKSTFIGSISGNILPKIKNWILNTFVPNNYMYVLFNVFLTNNQSYENAVNNMFNTQEYIRRSICDTFCLQLFNFIKNNNAKINYVTPPYEAISAIFVDSKNFIQKLDSNNKTDKQEIINYYTNLQTIIAKILDKINNKLPDIQKTNIKQINYKNLIKNITNDYFTIGNIIKNLNLSVLILYSYDTNNQPIYYKIKLQPNLPIFMNYVPSPYLRNVPILDINYKKVELDYLDNKLYYKENNYYKIVTILLILILIISIIVILNIFSNKK